MLLIQSVGQVIATVFFFAYSPEIQPDISRLDAHASSRDDDREAFEFAYALHLARQVDREAVCL